MIFHTFEPNKFKDVHNMFHMKLGWIWVVMSPKNWVIYAGMNARVELFLGKRRYFSGIAALTPLTPLTYKQNAVNAFIPTKKRR